MLNTHSQLFRIISCDESQKPNHNIVASANNQKAQHNCAIYIHVTVSTSHFNLYLRQLHFQTNNPKKDEVFFGSDIQTFHFFLKNQNFLILYSEAKHHLTTLFREVTAWSENIIMQCHFIISIIQVSTEVSS